MRTAVSEENNSVPEVETEPVEVQSRPKINKLKKRTLVPWTEEQKQVVRNYFLTNIERKKPPKRLECEDLKSLYPELLKNKDWLKIKVFIQNLYKNNKK